MRESELRPFRNCVIGCDHQQRARVLQDFLVGLDPVWEIPDGNPEMPEKVRVLGRRSITEEPRCRQAWIMQPAPADRVRLGCHVSDFIKTGVGAALYGWPMTTYAKRYRTGNASLINVLENVGDWSAESPCDGWTVLDVLNHLIDTQRDFLEQRGIDIGPRPDTSADPLGAWKAHSSAVQNVLETPSLAEKSFDGFFGPATVGATLATFYGFDLLVHRWDIARGAGMDSAFTDAELDLIEQSLDGFGEHLYMEGICKPALTAAVDADRGTRLLARMGRDAHWLPAVNA